jgi:hypothetical protein
MTMSFCLRSVALTMPLALLASAACSTADDLCTLVCDCEHCNDWEEEAVCGQIALSQDVASTYECDAAWDAWAECFENNGECYDDAAAFSTSEIGMCNIHVDVLIACSTDAECRQEASHYFCSNGTCVYKACSNSPAQEPIACASHHDCPAGEDRCGQEALTLYECEQKAADINVTPVYGTVPEY